MDSIPPPPPPGYNPVYNPNQGEAAAGYLPALDTRLLACLVLYVAFWRDVKNVLVPQTSICIRQKQSIKENVFLSSIPKGPLTEKAVSFIYQA